MATTEEKQRVLPEKLLTVRDVSEFLNVHPNTVRGWSNNGVLPAYWIGPRPRRRFKLEDIETFIQGNGRASS
jgi:excisionase family DNA binding protein